MSQLTSIKGFTNMPTTRSVCLITTVAAVALSILQYKHLVRLSIDPFILEYYQLWRLVTYQLAVVNESDYLLVILLWFHFKYLERFFGSRKYISTITLFAVFNAVACFGFMYLGSLSWSLLIRYIRKLTEAAEIPGEFTCTASDKKRLVFVCTNPPFNQISIFNEVIPGPLGILSSLYVCYGAYMPSSYQFKILLANPFKASVEDTDTELESNAHSDSSVVPDAPTSKELTLTNHFPIHIIYTILLFNNGFRSIIPCLIGIVIGKLYTIQLLPFSSWLIPSFSFRLFIAPLKSLRQFVEYLRRVRFYVAEDSGSTNLNQPGASEETPEDDDEVLDEDRVQERQIRAETPIRPLGTQILNPFRS